MSKFTKGIAITIICLLFFSCIPLRYTTIDLDVYEPPGFNLKNDYKNIGIMYKNPVMLDDSLSRIFMNLFPDSLHTERFKHNAVADYYLRVLCDFFENSGYYNEIIMLPDTPADMPANIDSIEFKIHTEEIVKYKSEYPEMDLLLFLDFFNSKGALNFSKYFELFNMYIYTSTIWQINDFLFDSLSYFKPGVDTLVWRGNARSQKQAATLLPSDEMMMLEGAEESAVAFGKYMTPHWETVSRMLYISGNYELKQAQELIRQNRWDEAAEMWEKYADNKNPVIAAKATYNLAVACEMSGDIPAALDWLTESYQKPIRDKQTAFEHKINVVDYINVLAKRKLEMDKLDGMNLTDGF